MKPLCFVAMPFGEKPRPEGGPDIDFNAVYEQIIRPAIEAADMEPLRADEELVGGITSKPMFERLILSDYVVADLTTASASVFYELGVRHAMRPYTTVPIFAADSRLPFDLGPVRAVPYALAGSEPADAEAARSTLTEALLAAKNDDVDSPVFQLLDAFGPPSIVRLRTDAFRDRVEYAQDLKRELSWARHSSSLGDLNEIRDGLGAIEDVEAGVAVDLYLSYRDVEAYDEMVDLAHRMPRPVAHTPLVREQLGFALNRLGRRDEAEAVLLDLIEQRGPSSETLGILGRVYKDRRDDSLAAGDDIKAQGYLKKAIDTYLRGFESDWRDPYPGINAVTLMELSDPPDVRRTTIAPVVMYSAQRRIAAGDPDYWDHATVLEAAVLANDRETAMNALASALPEIGAPWQPATTLNNLDKIVWSLTRRGARREWLNEIRDALRRVAGIDDEPEDADDAPSGRTSSFDQDRAQHYVPRQLVEKTAILLTPSERGAVIDLSTPFGKETMRGPFYLVAEDGESYGAAQQEFEATHQSLGEHRWQKSAPIDAYRTTEACTIDTYIDGQFETTVEADAGHWIVRQATGEVMALTPADFDERYVPAD